MILVYMIYIFSKKIICEAGKNIKRLLAIVHKDTLGAVSFYQRLRFENFL